MTPDLYCCIAAYNEENNIEPCISSLANQNTNLNLETIICLNGCSDDTERKTNNIKDKFPTLNIKIIHSEKGKAHAQNAIVNYVTNKKIPIMFVDADVVLSDNCLTSLYEELLKTKKLVVVGSWPKPRHSEHSSTWQTFLFNTLHVRAFFPESEISKHDVRKFKDYVHINPQRLVSPDFELKSKIYFHGRAYMMRNASYFKMPADKNITDDTYLPNMIHTTFGPGTIRTRYDAEVFYKPYLSLRGHFSTYRRVFLDKLHLDAQFGEFKDSRLHEQTKLDWKFILSQQPKIIARFLAYNLIKQSEQIMYNILPKREASELWTYSEK